MMTELAFNKMLDKKKKKKKNETNAEFVCLIQDKRVK